MGVCMCVSVKQTEQNVKYLAGVFTCQGARYVFFFFTFFPIFETGSGYIVQAGLRLLVISLTLSSRCWGYRTAASCPAPTLTFVMITWNVIKSCF